ncbi:MAG: MFS transporter [Coprothermobacterota bacterium]|nr:MFS transporter [Coprothermobacterota bacterium]
MKESSTTRQQAAVLWVTALASFAVPFMVSAINIILPSISTDFAAPAVTVTWLVTAYLICTSGLMLPWGRLGDLYGRKRIFLAGLALFALASLLAALAPAIEWLIAIRVLQGLGGGMVFGTNIALLTGAFPPGRRGQVLGWNISATYLGLSLGPPLAGFLSSALGWRSVFLFTAVTSLAVCGYGWAALRGKEWKGAQGRFDLFGAILFACGITLFIYGVSSAGSSAWNWVLAGVGILGLVLFLRWEGRAAYPLIEARVFFHNVTFLFSSLAALIHYAATYALAVVLALYLQIVQGFPPQLAGLVLLVQPLVQALVSPLAGRIADRVEPRLLASLGMGGTSLGLFFFIFLGPSTSVGWIAANLVLIGIGYALFSSPNTYAVMSSVPVDHFGVASAALAVMRSLGQAISMATLAFLFTLFIGGQQFGPEAAPQFLAGIRVGFIFFFVLSLLGIVASLARGRVHSTKA